jgi:hypothetical protein
MSAQRQGRHQQKDTFNSKFANSSHGTQQKLGWLHQQGHQRQQEHQKRQGQKQERLESNQWAVEAVSVQRAGEWGRTASRRDWDSKQEIGTGQWAIEARNRKDKVIASRRGCAASRRGVAKRSYTNNTFSFHFKLFYYCTLTKFLVVNSKYVQAVGKKNWIERWEGVPVLTPPFLCRLN